MSDQVELPLELFRNDADTEPTGIQVGASTVLPLKVDEWVRVTSPRGIVLCRAWPSGGVKTGFVFPRRPSITCAASFQAQSNLDLANDVGAQTTAPRIDRLAQTLTPAKAANIRIAEIANDEIQIEALGFVLTKVHPLVRRKMLATLLEGYAFCKGCIIALLDGVLEVQVMEADSTDGFHLFTDRTRLLLVEDTPINHSSKETASSIFETPPTLSVPIPTGLETAFHSLHDIVKLPLLHSELVQKLNVDYPKGVLLYGPPGVGKTLLVSTVARYCSASLFIINGSEVFGSHLGESEERIRTKFNEALEAARSQGGKRASILFIDEIDAIAPNRNESSQSDSRMVATLLTLMDGMKSQSDRLIILAATNRPNAIDPALRRPGRFDREIAIDAPSESARFAMLRSMVQDIGNVDASIDFNALAIATNGYVGADLMALCREAVMHCLEAGDGNTVSNADFVYGLSVTTPSTTRGYAVGVPSGLTWDSVGGLEDVKLKLQQCVEWPITRRETFLRLGLKPPRGVLLYGPPGCSKTTLVKIIACTSNATFLSINGASLYSPFVGDSEQSVRALFHRARLSAPSVIFLDEIDAIVGSRDLSGGGGGTRDATQESVLSTLLNEMDGIEVAKDVLVVGATNRPDMIDAALMRPGRFDKILYVPPPDLDARLKILHLYSKGMPLSPSIDFGSIAERTERYTGADLESVCREAAFAALRERKDEAGVVEACHFEDALISVKPSLSLDMLKQYAGFSGKFGKGTRR